MACCYELFQTFAVFVVGIQLVFGVFRWIYGNVIGPKYLEPKNIRQYGKWACKLIVHSHRYRAHLQYFSFNFYSSDRRHGWNWQAVCKISKQKSFPLKI